MHQPITLPGIAFGYRGIFPWRFRGAPSRLFVARNANPRIKVFLVSRGSMTSTTDQFDDASRTGLEYRSENS